MEVNLSIKNVPADVAERLRRRAERNHRSLQGELMAIIEQAALQADGAAVSGVRSQAGNGLVIQQGWKTIEQLVAEREASDWKPHPSLAKAPWAVDIVRADRDSR